MNNRKIDLASISGWLIAVTLMFIGITLTKEIDSNVYQFTPANIFLFFDPTSIAIVLGGTLASLMVSFPLSQLRKVPKHIHIILSPKLYRPQDYIEKLAECAQKARVSGLLTLEDDIEGMEDTFMKSSLLMVVDSVDPEKVKQQMSSWLDNLDERHAQERSFYDKGAAYAPAFGMIGTLIGLINMLTELADVASVGPNMAVALVTTFYGTILSNLVFIPISNKLRVRHDEEYLCKSIIYEGVQGVQAGENPKFIQERLLNILAEYQQAKVVKREEAESGHKGGRGKRK